MDTASQCGHRLVNITDAGRIDDIIRLNSDTILERSGDAPTMEEMQKWIRTTEEDADGQIWFLVRMGYSREPARSYRLE